MKKTILNVLLVSFVLFMVSACDSVKKDEGPANTPVNFTDLNTLKGNYAVDGFATIANTAQIIGSNMVFTNNCAMMKANVENEALVCDDAKNVSLASQARITLGADNKLVIETKVQMWGGNFSDLVAIAGDLVKSNSYNYTKYSDVVVTAADSSFGTVTVTGRDFKGPSTIDTPNMIGGLLPDGRIAIELVASIGGIPTTTYVILKKINDNIADMNPNTLVDSSKGFSDGFNADPIVTEASKFAGTYNVTFFGSQVTNARASSDLLAGFATIFYISNDCIKASELYPDLPVDLDQTKHKNICVPPSATEAGSQAKLQKGIVAIKVVGGKAYVTTKMEMTGVPLEMSAPDKYQYTEYAPVAFDESQSSFSGGGVTGYNYDDKNNKISASATENPASPFKVTLDADGKLDIEMTLIDKAVPMIEGMVDAVTRVLATKVGDYVPIENKIETDLTTAKP